MSNDRSFFIAKVGSNYTPAEHKGHISRIADHVKMFLHPFKEPNAVICREYLGVELIPQLERAYV